MRRFQPIELRRAVLASTGWPALVLSAAWLASMIGLPIAVWTFGSEALGYGVPLTVLLQAGAVLALVGRCWGTRRTVLVAGLAALGAWTAEAIGCTYGVPFGGYAYSALLQPWIGPVPAVIPLAWIMMLPPSWAVAQCLVGDAARSPLAFAVTSAVAFTCWDLFLDPQMVAWGFWSWSEPSGYFGIPWVNFAGWLLVSFVITLALRPARVSVAPLLGIYAVTWFLESIGLAVFWGLPGPALFGCVGMGSVLVLAIQSRWGTLRDLGHSLALAAHEAASRVTPRRAAREPRS